MVSRSWIGLLATATATLSGCQVSPPVPDYEKFYAQAPFTVVIPPVGNQTTDAEAPRFFLSTMTKPLIDRGYYVIPVEITAEILAADGITDGGQLEGADPSNFHQHFGADAVMFVTLTKWDTVYAVFASSVHVAMEYKLVSTRTGDTLWETSYEKVVQSSAGSGAGFAALISAAINAAATAAGTDYVPMAMEVNNAACQTLPTGPYGSGFEDEKRRRLQQARSRQPSEGANVKPGATSTTEDW